MLVTAWRPCLRALIEACGGNVLGICCVAADEVARRDLSAIQVALAEAGLNPSATLEEAEKRTAILVFAAAEPSLPHTVRSLSEEGSRRVLAVAADYHALSGQLAWRLLRAGASDVIGWDGAERTAAAIARKLLRWAAIDEVVDSPLVTENLVGRSSAWISALRRVVEVATCTDANVLIQGESGTGKEQVARLIHTLDRRQPKGELVVVDCTTIVPELAGSEFFGHERGAFTGAVSQRDGAFALADGGTLFADEISELPMQLQAQLLRVVQEHSYKRVGGNTWHRTHFRLVCASNRSLAGQVERGEFRRDLYYRIATLLCGLPPLRDRWQDIPLLARHFLGEHADASTPPELDPLLADWLLQREYPGNVRDLRQIAVRLMSRYAGVGPMTPGCLPEEDRPASEGEATTWKDQAFERAVSRAVSLGASLKEIERTTHETAIRLAVQAEGGSLQRAAVKLKVSDRLLQIEHARWRRAENRIAGLIERAD